MFDAEPLVCIDRILYRFAPDPPEPRAGAAVFTGSQVCYTGGMKIKRNWLLGITGGIGVFMIVYTLIRQFTGFTLGDQIEKQIFDGIFIAAIVLFMYNRKLAADERKEAAEAKKIDPPAPADTPDR